MKNIILSEENIDGFDCVSSNQFKFLFILKRNSILVHKHESTLNEQNNTCFQPIDKPFVFDEMYNLYGADIHLTVYIKRTTHKGNKIFAQIYFGRTNDYGNEPDLYIGWYIEIYKQPKCASFQSFEAEVDGNQNWPQITLKWGCSRTDTMNQSFIVELWPNNYLEETYFLVFFTSFFELSSK
jgi:hypothetical protein